MKLNVSSPAEALERFGDSFGIPRGIWTGEGFDEVSVPADTKITAGALSRCTERVVELVRAYGEALITPTACSKIKGLSGDLEFRPDLTEERVASFLDRIRQDLNGSTQFDGFPLELILRLDKRKLIETYLQDLPEDLRSGLFLYPAGLAKLVSGPLSTLEPWWAREAPQQLVLFVPAWEHFLAGPLLAVVGGDPRVGLDRLLGSRSKVPVSLPEGVG